MVDFLPQHIQKIVESVIVNFQDQEAFHLLIQVFTLEHFTTNKEGKAHSRQMFIKAKIIYFRLQVQLRIIITIFITIRMLYQIVLEI